MRQSRSKRRTPPQVYSTPGGSLVHVYDAHGGFVVAMFDPELEGACSKAQAVVDFEGDGTVRLHWSCDCCGSDVAFCRAVEE